MFYIKLRHTYFGNFSIRFWGKNSQFLLGNGSFYRTCMQGILCPGPSLGMSLMHTMQLYAWFQWFVSMYIKIMLFSFLNIAWYVQEFNFTSNKSVLYIYIYILCIGSTNMNTLPQWFWSIVHCSIMQVFWWLYSNPQMIGSLTSVMIVLILSPSKLSAQF